MTRRTKGRGLGKGKNIKISPFSHLVQAICFKVLICGNYSTSLSSQLWDWGEKSSLHPVLGSVRCSDI